MEELCSILSHKLQLIISKITYKDMSNSEKDELLEFLLIEKKKQSLRVLVQTRLQQATATRHITLDQEINQIKNKCYQIMKIYLPDFSFNQEQTELQTMVKMFANFFTAVQCSNRSKQIISIYEKRLCPKSLMPSTMFNWFVEWTRKQFKEYLKVHIHSLYLNSRQPLCINKEDKEASNQKGKDDKGKKSKIQEAYGISLESLHKKSIIHNRQVKKEQKPVKQTPKPLQNLRIMSQKSIKILNKENHNEDQICPINREIFLSAFAQELQTLYKSIENCIPDLESGWARRLKKGWRREQVARRVSVVVESCIKQMPQIKQSVDQYFQFYKKNYIQKYGIKIKQGKKRKREFQMFKSKIQKDKNKKKNTERYSFDKAEQKDQKREKFHKNQFQKQLVSRDISTTPKITKRTQRKLTSSLSSNHRYQLEFEDKNQSNLLITTNRQSRIRKHNHLSFQITHKTIDLTFDRRREESSFILLNPRNFTHQLDIIEERAKKMKGKTLNSRPKKKDILLHKQKQSKEYYRSLDADRNNGKILRSVEQTNNIGEKLYIKLPKLRGLK